jgi:hypothetical protein
MKIKRIRSVIMALAVALLIPASAFASTVTPLGAGEWDTLHSGYYTIPGGTGEVKTETVYSGGGDFRVCVYDLKPYNSFFIQLWEDDGGSRQPVGDLYWVHNNSSSTTYCQYYWGIGNYVDGSNGKAEFYAEVGPADESDYVLITLDD